jgi:mono/diheme cytochrome c family protein
MRVALSALLILLVVLGIAAAVALSGAINVAASQPEGRLTEWVLGTIAHRSIARHADEERILPALDSAALASGLDHFHAMCVECHGAPGFERGEVGEGLSPRAPALSEVIEEGEWSDAELFWIVKHGIRMTGMPAFGQTHTDDDLWAIVGVMTALPEWGEDGYRRRVDALLAPAPGDSADGTPQSPNRSHVHADGQEHAH